MPGKWRDRQERLEEIAALRMHATSADTAPYGYLTTRQVAERYGKSMRTIERDKRELRQRAAS